MNRNQAAGIWAGLQRLYRNKVFPSSSYHEVATTTGSDSDDELPVAKEGRIRPMRHIKPYRAMIVSFLIGFAFAISVGGILVYLTAIDRWENANDNCVVSHPAPSPSPAASISKPTKLNPAPSKDPTQSVPVNYSRNWAGVALSSPPPDSSRFAATLATITLPRHPLLAHNTSGPRVEPWSASVWVGLDGESSKQAILQTGVDMLLYPSGAVSYKAWYEWWPDRTRPFPLEHALEPGDTLDLEVVMYNGTHGKATVRNRNKNETIDQFLNAPTSSAQLKGLNAEWIMEDFWLVEDGKNVPLVDFDQFEMVNCRAYTDTQKMVTAAEGQVYWMKQDALLRTQVAVEDTTVSFFYVQ